MAHSLLGDPLQVLQESRGTMSLAKWGLGQVGGSGVEEPRVTDCSLLPAAGTVSVGTSSCLSLSQHPSPTSVFRHHYIPYFRGKACSAQRGGARPMSPHGFQSPVSHACVLPVLCVSGSVSSVCPCPWKESRVDLSPKVQLEEACQ